MTTYTNTQASQIFKTTRENLRRWAVEFSDFLSPTANPIAGKGIREYTYEDLKVLALIAQMKALRKQPQDIILALENGDRGEPPDDVTTLAFIGSKNAPAHLQKHIATLETALTEIKHQLEDAKSEVQGVTAVNKYLQIKLADTEKKLEEAHILIGQLKK